MAERGEVKRRGSWLVRAGVAIVVLLALLIVLAIAASRPPLSNALVSMVLQSRGAGPARVSGAHIGLGGTKIEDVSAGQALAIKKLDARYSFPGILFGQVKSVRAQSLSITAAFKDGGISLPVVGKLGGGKPGARKELRLPAVAIEDFGGAVTGLPVPARLGGRLALVPAPRAGSYRLDFKGTSDFGSVLSTEIGAAFDGAGNADVNVNANASGENRPTAQTAVPRVLVDRIVATAKLVRGKVQSANADLDIREGHLREADFGPARMKLAMTSASAGELTFDASEIHLAKTTADQIEEKIASATGPLKDRPPLSAHKATLDTLTALAHGTATLTGKLQVAQRGSGEQQLWHLEIDSLQANVANAGKEMLRVETRAAKDGARFVNLGIGKNMGSAAQFGLAVTGSGLDVDAESVLVLAGSAFRRINSIEVIGLSARLPSKALTLGLDARQASYFANQRDMLRLTGTLKADGTLLDGISTKGMAADLSGAVTKSGERLALVPNDGCYEVQFASLNISATMLGNGLVKACANGTTPIAAFGGGPAHIEGRLEGGPILVGATASSRVRVQTLTAGVLADLDAKPVVHLSNLQGRIVDAGKSARFAPLDITGNLDVMDDRVVGMLGATSGGGSILSAQLDHDLAKGAGTLRFDSGNLEFKRGGVEIQSLLPGLRGIVTSASGKLRMDGMASWTKGRAMQSRGTVVATAFGVTTKLGRVEGVDGKVALNRLWPTRTATPQTLHVKTMEFGLPLVDGDITFNLPEKFQLEIIRGVWPWAGGHLAVVDGTFVPGEKVQRLAMTAENIDLTELFKLLSIEGLSGSGIVDGRLPIEIREGEAFIVKGSLKARDTGILKYDSDATRQAAAQGQGQKLLFTALQNFHYQSLEIGVDGRVTGIVIVSLKLRGSNPEYNDGYPMELNISIESALANLVSQTTQGLRIGDDLGSLPGDQ